MVDGGNGLIIKKQVVMQHILLSILCCFLGGVNAWCVILFTLEYTIGQ